MLTYYKGEAQAERNGRRGKERKRYVSFQLNLKVKEKIKKKVHNCNKCVVTHDKGILIDDKIPL